jgi:hypothetical protein
LARCLEFFTEMADSLMWQMGTLNNRDQPAG